MRCLFIISLTAVTALSAQTKAPVKAPTGAPAAQVMQYPKAPERAIVTAMPMTNTIQRAFAAGTRDSSGRPGKNYWQTRVDYTIRASLDPATDRLTGHESIVVHNNSDGPMTSIRLRLDQNIFRAKSFLASPWVPSETTDGFVLTKVSVDGQDADLNAGGGGRGGRGGGGRGGGAGGGGGGTTPALSGQNTTSATLSLPNPIPAKGSATLVIEWNHKIPGAPGTFNHRMNQRWGDTLFQPTQWYPRVAVYDDLRGWDTEFYLGPSEFYNNFGTFDVSLDVPGGWIVSGTGVLKNPEQVLTAKARERLSHIMESDSVITVVGADEVGPGKSTAPGDRLVWHYVADTVNDFAWATAKDYIWQVTRVTIPGRSPMELHMVFQPGDARLYANAASVARHALQYYSGMWMPLDFPKLTMQDGPSNGMEYPMVINANQSAADHETGHQWWPMTVGTNETWYGWMDEGFNQYMNIWSNADAIGQTGNLNSRGQGYRSGNEGEGALMSNANYGGAGYQAQAYGKMPQVLSMLGGIVGDSAVVKAMSGWARTWKFKHPSPWDYFFYMDNALKQDLSWFWYYWMFANESVDGSLAKVTPTATGVTVSVHEAGEMPSPVILKVEFAPTGPAIRKIPNSVIRDSVTAIVTYPVNVWFGGARTLTFSLPFGARKITRIIFDPGCRFPDHFAGDNAWTPEAGIPVAPAGAALAGGRGGRNFAGAGGARGGAAGGARGVAGDTTAAGRGAVAAAGGRGAGRGGGRGGGQGAVGGLCSG